MRLADYHVRQLRLHVADEGDTTRGALLVEDALRTASVNTGARVLVVRRLALGKIDAGVSPASVALRVEQELLEIAGHAVSVRDTSAGSARAVYFDDALHVLSLLASRIAARERIDEWFWSLACPAARADLPRAEALRAVVLAAFDTGVGVLGPATVLRAIATRGESALNEFITALRWQDGQELFRRSGWSLPAARRDARTAAALAPLQLTVASTRVVRAWAARLGVSDARVTWVSAMLAVAERPARAADTSLPLRAAALVRDVSIEDTTRRDAPHQEDAQAAAGAPGPQYTRTRRTSLHVRTRDGDVAPIAERAAAETPHPALPAGHLANGRARTGEAHRTRDATPPAEASVSGGSRGKRREPAATEAGARIEQARDTRPTADPERAEAVSERVEQPLDFAVTAYAGVFYLLPLMRRLGAGDWLAARPHLLEQDFIARLLRHIADRIGAPPDDAVFDALHVADIDDDAAAEMAPLLAEWTTALRRWCRHNAQTGLVAIVRRNGKLSTTRTHVDVHFSLRQVDLRIRKAGLDVDPGWLPWFGRVVSFHYESEGWRRG
jgi:hypothetical protein